MTLKTAKEICKQYGCTLRHDNGEYRVNFRNGSEATAYYTNDIEDACFTARAMFKAGK